MNGDEEFDGGVDLERTIVGPGVEVGHRVAGDRRRREADVVGRTNVVLLESLHIAPGFMKIVVVVDDVEILDPVKNPVSYRCSFGSGVERVEDVVANLPIHHLGTEPCGREGINQSMGFFLTEN